MTRSSPPASPIPSPSAPSCRSGAPGSVDARCSVCGAAASTLRERADLGTDWLIITGEVVTGQVEASPRRFCRGCAPRGPVDDVACVRCGDGPLLAGELTAMTLEATLAVDDWLCARGWQLAGPVCPDCVGELIR